MDRATYLWYSLHIKLMSLIAMFLSLLFMVLNKKTVDIADKVGASNGSSPDPIIMAITLQQLLELGDIITVILNEYRDLDFRMLVMQSCYKLLDVPQEPVGQPLVQDKTWP